MVCSATSSNFYLPPRYETPNLDVTVSINNDKPSHDKHFSTRFPHMATPWE